MWISQLLLLLVCIRTELSDGQACDRSLFIDTDFPGKDFKQIITSSAQECQLACTLNELCVTFSYLTPQWTTDSRTNFCYLKNTSPSSNTLLNIISGKTLKFCDGVVSDPPKTYTVVSTQMSWTSALSICRTQFTDLATIYSENDWSQLLQTPGVTKGEFWIGLHEAAANQGWKWVDKDLVNYFNWFEGYGNALGTDCTTFYSTNWRPELCSNPFTFMCHYVYQGSNATLKTYEYVKDMKNWSDAQTACRSNGGELASIMNDKEQQAFVVMAPAGYSIWIGLSRNPVTQLWEWSSNNSFTTLFPPVNPGQNCTKLVNANQGKTDSCSVNKQVLCTIRGGTALPVTEVVSRNVVRVSMQLVGQVDPNDPVFAKQVLDTLQVQLAIRGTFNGNLNWTYQEDDKVFREKESSMTQP